MLAESLDDIENAFQQAVSGRPAELPFADICIPSVFDDSLAPAGKHVMSLFTQWVPYGYADDAVMPLTLEAYADRVLARVEAVAPGSTDSVLHRQVDRAAPDAGGVRADRRKHLPRGTVARPDVPRPGPRPATPTCAPRSAACIQAGSATHGGGGVTGIPGRNVVRQVLADRRAERWRRRVPRPSRVTRVAKASTGV